MLRMGRAVVTVVRAPLVAVGPGNRQERQWNSVGVLKVSYPFCAFQPLSTTEYIDDREFAETHWKAVAPGYIDVLSTDRVTCSLFAEPDGSLFVFEVSGDPEFWPDMDGRQHHTTFLAKRWVG
jgi:hypothetical protein